MPHRNAAASKVVVALLVIALLGIPPTGGSGGDDERTMPVPINIVGSPGMFIDEFDDDRNVTLEGDMTIIDGELRLDPRSLFEDGFNRSQMTPWTVTGGSPELVDGRLHLNSSSGANDTVTRSIDHEDLKLIVLMNFTTYGTGGPFITLKFEDKSLRFLYDFGGDEMIIQVIEPGGDVIEVDQRDANIYQDLEFIFRVSIGGNEPLFHLQQEQRPGYAPNWRTAPYEFNRTGNVTEIELGCWGDADGYLEDLVVVDLGSVGTAYSSVIELPQGCMWDEATVVGNFDHTGVVSIIDALTGDAIPRFQELYYGRDFDLQDIDVFRHPSIRLKAVFWLKGTSEPTLWNWSVSWKPGAPMWMDSFDDMSRCTPNNTGPFCFIGGAHWDWEDWFLGAVGINTTMWLDDFSTDNGSPWSTIPGSSGGDVRVEDGCLWIEGPDTVGEWTGVEYEFDLPGLLFNFEFFVDVNGPGGFEINISTETGKAFILTKDVDNEVIWLVWDGYENHVVYDLGRFWMGYWYDSGEILLRQDGDHDFGGGGMFTGGYHYFAEDFTRLQIRCGQGFDMHLDRMKLHEHRQSGDVVSELVVLPDDMRWTKARVIAGLETARLTVLDASTSEPVPGYGDLSSSDLAFEDGAYVLDMRGIDPDRHPALRLLYEIHAFEAESPFLSCWQLWWEPGSAVLMDPFDDDDGIESTEDITITDGRVTTPNILFEDDFNRYDLFPWVVEEGAADTLEGSLWTQSREAQETTVALDLSELGPDGISIRNWAYRIEDQGPGVELRGADGRSYTIGYDGGMSRLSVSYDNLIGETTIWSQTYDWEFNEWLEIDIQYDSTTMAFRIGVDNFTVPVPNYFALDSLVLHSGNARYVHWDDLVVSRKEVIGSAITDLITIPEGEGWLWLEVEHGSPGNSSLTMSLVNAVSGVTIPGFEDMSVALYDIGAIDIEVHPIVQLMFEMTGEYRDVPYVDWYRIYWTGMADQIIQINDFEDIEVLEDTPVAGVLNVTDYFTSTLMDLSYEVTGISDPKSVLPRLVGWELSIDLPKEHWWGNVTFQIAVTNGVNTLTTEPISVIVIPVDDPPVFQDVDIVIVTEDEAKEVHVWGWLFYDVDTEFVDLVVEVPDGNATVDGYAIELLFETGGFERDLLVIVSDGTTTVEGSLSVRVLSVDDPPIIDYIGKQYVPEDEFYILDLAPYIIDEDTPLKDLIVAIEEPNCTVDGLLLTFYYGNVPEGSLDLRLTLTVSDGTSTVDATLRVLAMDIPVITFSPEVKEVPTQLFRVGEEGTMDFSPYVTDMDTPLEDLTIDCDHPDVVSCQGLTVTFRFSETIKDPMDITFNVSDRTSMVPASFKVVVTEDSGEDPEPAKWWTGGGGLLLLIVIVVTVVAVVAYLGKRAE